MCSAERGTVVSTDSGQTRQSPLGRRVVRLAVPGLLLGVVTTGVVSATTGSTTTDAGPAPVVAVSPGAAPALDPRSSSVSRSQSDARPALADAKAAKAAKEKAAKAKAAKEKAAKEKAARLKAAEAAKAEAKATAARKAAARAKAAEAKKLAAALSSRDTKFTRADLNVRAAADPRARLLTVLKDGARLSVTPVVRDGWRYVSYQGKGAWVKNQYLVDKRPAVATTKKKKKATVSRAAATVSSSVQSSARRCKSGSAMERGLTRDAIRVHRAICARFPSVTSYGGVRNDPASAHSSGRAVDAMVSGARGWKVARWVRANAKRLGVSEVIYAQRIWTVQRGREGWRAMSDRGSSTANHYDHVHVTVYGNRS